MIHKAKTAIYLVGAVGAFVLTIGLNAIADRRARARRRK